MRFDFLLPLIAAWLLPFASSKRYPAGIVKDITDEQLDKVYHCKMCYTAIYGNKYGKDSKGKRYSQNDVCCEGPWLFIGTWSYAKEHKRNIVGAFGEKSKICSEAAGTGVESNSVFWTIYEYSLSIAPHTTPPSAPVIVWAFANTVGIIQKPRLYDDTELTENWLFRRVWNCPENDITTPKPSKVPTAAPTKKTLKPTIRPSSRRPTMKPTARPTRSPTRRPSRRRSPIATRKPSIKPTLSLPVGAPTPKPSTTPKPAPTVKPSTMPTTLPTVLPTPVPFTEPTPLPTPVPTVLPTPVPTVLPTPVPTVLPTPVPFILPTPPITLPPMPETPPPTPAPTVQPTPSPTGTPVSLDNCGEVYDYTELIPFGYFCCLTNSNAEEVCPLDQISIRLGVKQIPKCCRCPFEKVLKYTGTRPACYDQ